VTAASGSVASDIFDKQSNRFTALFSLFNESFSSFLTAS